MNKSDTSDILQEIKSVSSHINTPLLNELHDLLMNQTYNEIIDIKFEIDIILS